MVCTAATCCHSPTPPRTAPVSGHAQALAVVARQRKYRACYQHAVITDATPLAALCLPQCRVLADKYDRLHYVGCGSAALLTAAGNINTTLMPDASFPSPAGYDRLFSQCWGPAIGQLLASQQCQNPVSTAPCITAQFQRGHCVAGACQVTCNPATNCQGPCRQCDTSSDTCQELDPTQTCTTAGSAAGHCAAGGDCKVRQPSFGSSGSIVKMPARKVPAVHSRRGAA